MVSSRVVIDLAVSVLDAVTDLHVPASDVFDAVVEDTHASGSVGPPPAPIADTAGSQPVERDLLAAEVQAEVQPLLDALERHLERMRSLRSSWLSAVNGAPDPEDPGLTAREMEALALLSHCFTASATARRMGCSTSTVNKHLGNVYRKLGVSDRLGAVLEAQRRGLLGWQSPEPVTSAGRPLRPDVLGLAGVPPLVSA